MATSETNQVDLTPDIKVKNLSYGSQIYSTPKLSGILADITGKQITTNNVFFTEDIILAGEYEKIGNITKELTGTAILPAAGQSVDSVLRKVFTKELSGYVSVQPTVTAAFESGTYAEYEAGESFSPKLKGTFTDGQYKYGPEPQLMMSQWKFALVDSNNIITPRQDRTYQTGSYSYTHSYNQITANDGMSLKLQVSATYLPSGSYANTNIGRKNSEAGFDDIRIENGTAEASKTITCYRNIFIGSTSTDNVIITDAFIHTLTKVKSAATTIRLRANATQGQIPLVANAKCIIVAVPPGRTLNEVKLVSASNTPITESYAFVGNFNVTGANSLYPVSYKIYSYSPARIGQDEIHDIKFT